MSEWIRCDERLSIEWTDRDGHVHVIVSGDGIVEPAKFFKKGLRRGFKIMYEQGVITHWQPLPEPAK